MLICVYFMFLLCGLKYDLLFVGARPEGLLTGQVRLFPVSVTCSKHEQIYAFPVELSKPAEIPV